MSRRLLFLVPFINEDIPLTNTALGTLSGGWRIVRTMGQGITQLRPVSGFAAETYQVDLVQGFEAAKYKDQWKGRLLEIIEKKVEGAEVIWNLGADEIEIAASPQSVWDVLTDFEHWPSWNPDVVPLRRSIATMVAMRPRLRSGLRPAPTRCN